MKRWRPNMTKVLATDALFLAAVLLLCAPQVARADGPNDWPMFGHDPAHSGYNSAETQLKPPLRLKWTYQTGGSDASQPVVSNGIVYTVASDGKLYALDTATGSLRWGYTTSGALSGPPAVANGLLYVGGSSDGLLHALDAAAGVEKWTFDTSNMFMSPPYAMSSPVVTTDTVYLGALDVLYAVQASTGAVRWQSEVGTLDWPPAVSNNVVYAAAAGQLRALDATTGALKWLHTIDSHVSSLVAGDGAVFVDFRSDQCPCPNEVIQAIDATTGSLKWSFSQGSFGGPPQALANGMLYVPSNYNHRIQALDAHTGTDRWEFSFGLAFAFSSPTLANGITYVSSYGGLWALDSQTGALRWEYPRTYACARASSAYNCAPAIANGMAFAVWYDNGTNIGGRVYAFEAQPPASGMLPLSPYQTASASFPISWTVAANWTGTAAASYDVQYQDGPSGAWTSLLTASAPVSSTASAATFNGGDGHTYSFRVRSNTVTGAVGDWSQPVSTTVDLTPPTGALQAQGWSSPYISNTIVLYLSATDATSRVSQMQFGRDGLSYNPWQAYAISSTYTLGLGETTVYARFTDGAGNISQSVSSTVPLDTTPPGPPQPDDGVSGTSGNPRPTFRWTGVTDDLSGVAGYYYKVDDGPDLLTVGTVVTLTTQSDGDHIFYVHSRDRAANYSPYGSHAFSIKNNRPSAPGIFQPQTPIASDHTVVTGTSELGMAVKLYVNGSLFGQTAPGNDGSW
ncbi:MAG: PQQ-binding-like beta-propeller repeat protein, partial [Dehalococcoidia bacterium]|nr:PQQ-binding-like beta-propeller repeat protein [Dehalococcoidia bacterium]